MSDISPLQKTLLDWFDKNRRDLPWRKRYDPYEVWISEVILQQTQMDRGVAYIERFLERFPTMEALAAGDEEEVLKLWEGLGYYARARNLRKAAQQMVQKHGGTFPEDVDAARALPGVGRYTAGAVLSQAYNLEEPIVDANVERVLSRLFDVDAPIKSSQAQSFLWETARALIPKGRARDFNQAIMEFGNLVCGKKPSCMFCPLTEECEAYYLGIVDHRPVPAERKPAIPVEVASGVLVHDGYIFIQKRPEGGVWPGLWEFPGGNVEKGETPAECVVREFREELEWDVETTEKVAVIRHGYTTFKVTLTAFLLRFTGAYEGWPEPVLHNATEGMWVSFAELDKYTFPAGHRKLIDMMSRDMRYAWLV